MKYICIVITCISLLTGCSSHVDKDKQGTENDIQSINMNYSMVDSVYITIGNGGVKFIDLDNGTEIYACNQPGCAHEESSKCLAFPNIERGDVFYEFPFMYQEKLYYFAKTREQTIRLIRSDIDGSNRVVLMEQEVEEFSGLNVIRVEDKVYYSGKISESEMEDGHMNTKSVNVELYEVDLNSGDCQQISNLGTYYDGSIVDFFYSEGAIYYHFSSQNKSWEETDYKHPADRLDALHELDQEEYVELLQIRDEVGVIDLVSKEESRYPLDIFSTLEGISGENLFIYQNGTQMMAYDKNMENGNLVFELGSDEEEGMHLETIGNQLLLRYFESYTEPGYYYLWNPEEEKFEDLGYREDYSLHISSYSDSKLLIALVPLKSFSESSEWNYILADREDFFKGTLNYSIVEVDFHE